MKKKFHIITYGCQMNKYDSMAITERLMELGHVPTEDVGEADVIIVNTCAVREHAEKRALGRIRNLLGLKKSNPELKVGIIGCVAQEHGEKLFELIPELDFVVGTEQLDKIEEIVSGRLGCGVFVESREDFLGVSAPAHIESGQVSSFVTIMRGCNNFCSYCIVPFVRGRERYRPPELIIDEVKRAVRLGVKEITLLGQNVNSYRFNDLDFADLLRLVAKTEGLKRLRFVTNHPKDFTTKILDVVEEFEDKIPPAFHLPLQSGSDKILSAMNRKYTLSQYMKLVEQIYARFPKAAITTDIIVGFPGERDEDFMATIRAMEEVEFAGVFSFRYSPRPGTAAARLPDDVPETVKLDRLKKVIELGIKLAEKYSRKFIGTKQSVLVLGRDKKRPDMLRGTAPSGRTVVFPKTDEINPGDIVTIKISDASAWVLFGEKE